MSIDIEEQYDKIYRYCYFKLHSRESAEDITQEAFLRFLEHYSDLSAVSALKCLYTIARNLCMDEYRRPRTQPMEENAADGAMEEKVIVNLAVRTALSRLSFEEQELLLLRYVNEVPVGAIAGICGISRFSVHRRLKAASGRFREELRKEDFHESMEE